MDLCVWFSLQDARRLRLPVYMRYGVKLTITVVSDVSWCWSQLSRQLQHATRDRGQLFAKSQLHMPLYEEHVGSVGRTTCRHTFTNVRTSVKANSVFEHLPRSRN